MLSVIYAILFYLATSVMVVGVVMRIARYSRIPTPLKIATTPAPITRGGVFWRMVREVTLFESLFKANRWIWVFGWAFHVGMALVLLRHLRYFTEPVWGWVALIQPIGVYASFAMVLGLLGLWARRVLVERIRYISSPSDHLMLAMLVGIGLSGMAMKFVTHTDVIAVKSYMLGLMQFKILHLPADPILLVHLTLVIILMIIFPISKLLHAPGVFFSPSRAMSDNPREKRHVAGTTAT